MEPFIGYVYLIKNLQNNKVYIGQTINLEIRIKSHLNNKKNKTHFEKAILKYGKHNFSWRILGECLSKEELNLAEKECISFFESNDRRYGYNLTDGGDGGHKFSVESRQKMSEAHKGKPSHLKGKHLSNETKQKLSQVNKGKKLSKETCEKMSQAFKGRQFSKEHKIKLSEASKGNKNMLGKHHSEETKNKIRETKKRNRGAL